MKKMNLKMYLFLSLCSMMAMAPSATGQEVEAVLEGMQFFYQDHPSIYQEMSYQLFASHEASELHSTESGLLILGPDARYSKLASIESLSTKDYTLGVDHEEKTIMLSNNFSTLTLDPMASIQNYSDQLYSASIKEVSANSNELIFKIMSGEVEEAKIVYNKADFQIEKIMLNYRRAIQLEDAEDADWVQPRLEIAYFNTSFSGKEKERLKLDNYVSTAAKEWKAVEKYANYQLIENFQDNPFSNK